MSMEERRKSPRITTVLQVRYRQEGNFKGGSCTSLDISLGGMGLTLPEKISPGDSVELEIKLSQTPFPLFVMGKVVWSFKAPVGEEEKNCYRTGVMFVDMPENVKKRLYDYIQEMISGQANP